MTHTPRIAAIIAALTFVTPALAIDTPPEPPKEQPEKPKPEPKQREKPKPEPRVEARPERESMRENECPYDYTNKWHACHAPAESLRPKARPVTVQELQGEKHD